MKYLIVFSFILASWMNCLAQSASFNYKGDWSPWVLIPGEIKAFTDGSGLVLYTPGGMEFLKFQINGFRRPTKKELKEHLESDKWFTYYGTVDYYVSDEYPNAEALAKANTFVQPNPRTDMSPKVKRHTVCEIRMAPYKNNPKTYNLFFDDIGLALSVKGLEFQGQKNPKNKGRVVANIVQSVLLFPIGLGSWLWNPVYDHKGE